MDTARWGGRAAVLALVLMLGCGKANDSTSPEAGVGLATTTSVDLSPFLQSRFWKLLDVGNDPQWLVNELGKFPQKLAIMSASVPAREPGPGDLQHQVPTDRRFLFALAPVLLDRLVALDAKPEWTEVDAAAANAVLDFLEVRLGAPKVDLVGSIEDRHQQVLRVGRWLEDEGTKPEMYAAMLFTMDDGPFQGISPGESELPAPAARAGLGESLVATFHERRTGGDAAGAHWIIRTVKDGRLVDSRLLTTGEGDPYARVDLSNLNTVPLGRWGYRLNFSIAGELTHLYVATDGKILFYFVSW